MMYRVGHIINTEQLAVGRPKGRETLHACQMVVFASWIDPFHAVVNQNMRSNEILRVQRKETKRKKGEMSITSKTAIYDV